MATLSSSNSTTKSSLTMSLTIESARSMKQNYPTLASDDIDRDRVLIFHCEVDLLGTTLLLAMRLTVTDTATSTNLAEVFRGQEAGWI